MFLEQAIFVNMDEGKIIEQALNNLKKNTDIVGIVRDYPEDVDALLELVFRNKTFQYLVEVKREFRQYQIPQTTYLQKKFKKKVMVIAEYIFPAVKEELRKLDIFYLEANGNIYVNLGDNLIWIELKETDRAKPKRNRAFTPSGVQVIFELLLHPELMEMTQREIAHKTKVALGQVNNVIKGLQEEGFIIQKTKNQLLFTRKDELLDEWLIAFHQRLKPKLRIGKFRFVNRNDFEHWNEVLLNTKKTKWGSEPAGNLLTDYLYPQKLTLYTTEEQPELIKNYKMVPDKDGDIEVFKMFWQNEEPNERTVPPILAYADLINKPDKRCRETANMIYEQQIKNRLI